MTPETELEIARLSGEISALRQIMASLLARHAAEYGEEAESVIMTITEPLVATAEATSPRDPASAAAMSAFARTAAQLENDALERLP